MRFCVERNLLTDDSGKAVPLAHPHRVSRVFVDASDAAEAILSLAREDGGEIVQRIHKIADRQAMATLRQGFRAIMMHAYPEEEAEWRAGPMGENDKRPAAGDPLTAEDRNRR